MTDFPWYPQIDGCRECGATEPEGCTCVHFEPLLLHSDDGLWLLADSAEHARTWLAEYEPDIRVTDDAGWMHDVGWNRDEYETKAEFDRAAGLNSWWEGCRAPKDGRATEKCRRAFEVTYAA